MTLIIHRRVVQMRLICTFREFSDLSMLRLTNSTLFAYKRGTLACSNPCKTSCNASRSRAFIFRLFVSETLVTFCPFLLWRATTLPNDNS